MFRRVLATATSLLVAAAIPPAISAEAVRKQVGDSTHTSIIQINLRVDDIPDSGHLVFFSNGLHQVDYNQLPEIDEARIGDPVLFCLVQLPKDCHSGDDRGQIYKTTD